MHHRAELGQNGVVPGCGTVFRLPTDGADEACDGASGTTALLREDRMHGVRHRRIGAVGEERSLLDQRLPLDLEIGDELVVGQAVAESLDVAAPLASKEGESGGFSSLCVGVAEKFDGSFGFSLAA